MKYIYSEFSKIGISKILGMTPLEHVRKRVTAASLH